MPPEYNWTGKKINIIQWKLIVSERGMLVYTLYLCATVPAGSMSSAPFFSETERDKMDA